ncbi:hypothetical protein [Ferrimonas marina]|uniref:Uncharacterized protein n=1 Tax=Ferrimonas marina TaxID=299255 RepID=A0A1M5UCR4_9GAMM|nr:hypothetical protein [Ferrimonas marina]SHH60845.1 hypothetical protein SAMN02745129_2509 [Ferrimonas marina]
MYELSLPELDLLRRNAIKAIGCRPPSEVSQELCGQFGCSAEEVMARLDSLGVTEGDSWAESFEAKRWCEIGTAPSRLEVLRRRAQAKRAGSAPGSSLSRGAISRRRTGMPWQKEDCRYLVDQCGLALRRGERPYDVISRASIYLARGESGVLRQLMGMGLVTSKVLLTVDALSACRASDWSEQASAKLQQYYQQPAVLPVAGAGAP